MPLGLFTSRRLPFAVPSFRHAYSEAPTGRTGARADRVDSTFAKRSYPYPSWYWAGEPIVPEEWYDEHSQSEYPWMYTLAYRGVPEGVYDDRVSIPDPDEPGAIGPVLVRGFAVPGRIVVGRMTSAGFQAVGESPGVAEMHWQRYASPAERQYVAAHQDNSYVAAATEAMASYGKSAAQLLSEAASLGLAYGSPPLIGAQMIVEGGAQLASEGEKAGKRILGDAEAAGSDLFLLALGALVLAGVAVYMTTSTGTAKEWARTSSTYARETGKTARAASREAGKAVGGAVMGLL